MKFSVPTAQLKAALAPVARAAASRTAQPVLSGALLTVKGDELILRGTDLTTTASTRVKVSNATDGAILVPAQLLSTLVNSLAGESTTVAFDAESASANVTSLRTKTSIRTLNPADFPANPAVTGATVKLPASEFKDALKAVMFAAASDESRPISGVCIDSSSASPVLISTDSYRLAMCTLDAWKLSEPVDKVVVSARVLADVARYATDADVKITIGENQIEFVTNSVTLATRRTVGDFPDVTPLLAMARPEHCTVEVAGLVEALKRVSPFAPPSGLVTLSIASSAIALTTTGDHGSIADEVSLIDTTADFSFSMNQKYLVDALVHLDTDKAEIFFTNDPLRPIELRPSSSAKRRSLVMPIRA